MNFDKTKLLNIICETLTTATIEKPILPQFETLTKLKEVKHHDFTTFPVAIKHLLKHTVMPIQKDGYEHQWHDKDTLEICITTLATNIALKIVEDIEKSINNGSLKIDNKKPRLETWREVVERIADNKIVNLFDRYTEHETFNDCTMSEEKIKSIAWRFVKAFFNSLEDANKHFCRKTISDNVSPE